MCTVNFSCVFSTWLLERSFDVMIIMTWHTKKKVMMMMTMVMMLTTTTMMMMMVLFVCTVISPLTVDKRIPLISSH